VYVEAVVGYLSPNLKGGDFVHLRRTILIRQKVSEFFIFKPFLIKNAEQSRVIGFIFCLTFLTKR